MANAMTVSEIAKKEKVSTRVVRDWIYDYGLKAEQKGKMWLVTPSDLAGFLKRHNRTPGRRSNGKA